MTSKRTVEVLSFGALLVAALGIVGWRWAASPVGLSGDQLESLALARSWVNGLGLRLAEGAPLSPAPVNLPWFVIQAGVLLAQLSPEASLPWFSLLFLGLTLVLIAFRGALAWRRQVQIEDVLPALALSLAGMNVQAAKSGSGAVVWLLLLAVSAVTVGRGFETGKRVWASLAVGVLAFFFPLAIWLIPSAGVVWWVTARRARRAATSEALGFVAGALAVASAVFLVRWLVGAPLLGQFPAELGPSYTRLFLELQSAWFWAALAATFVAALWRRLHFRAGGLALMWFAVLVVLAPWSASSEAILLGGMALLAMLVGDGLSAAREGATRTEDASFRGLSWTAYVGLTALLVLAATASYAAKQVSLVSQ